MRTIIRKKIIEGTSTPGIIFNLNYYFTHLDIYEDGTVNCWGLVDIAGLRKKIEERWIVTTIPDGKNISIHGLGAYKIKTATWFYSSKNYVKYIKSIIKKLNPMNENIFKMGKWYKKKNEERRILESPKAIDINVEGQLGFVYQEGDGFDIFVKHKNSIVLSHLCVYKKDKIKIFMGKDCLFEGSYKQGREYLSNNGITHLEKEQEYSIPNLGDIKNEETISYTGISEKVKELDDIINKINGNKTSLELCRNAYYQYLIYTDNYHRTKLKEAYENVPEHERCYLGDMDYRDSDYKRIIYNPEKKREV